MTNSTKAPRDFIEVKYGFGSKNRLVKVPCVLIGRYLAVHRALCPLPLSIETEPTLEKRRWTISHIPSGHAVNNKCSTRRQGIEVANTLEKRWRWNFKSKNSRPWKSQRLKIRDYLVEIRLMS